MKQLVRDIEFISKDIFQHFLDNSTKSDEEIETYSYYEVGYNNSAILKSIDKKCYYLYAFRINQEDSQALIYVGKTHDNSQRLKRHLQWKKDNGKLYAGSYKCQAKNIQEWESYLNFMSLQQQRFNNGNVINLGIDFNCKWERRFR